MIDIDVSKDEEMGCIANDGSSVIVFNNLHQENPRQSYHLHSTSTMQTSANGNSAERLAHYVAQKGYVPGVHGVAKQHW